MRCSKVGPPSSPPSPLNVNPAQGKNIFAAAAHTPTLNRLVYSALADTIALSNNKYKHVYHFASKAHAVNYARATYPDLMAKTSVIQVGGYLSNFLAFPGVKPQKDPQTGAYWFASQFPEAYRLPLVAAEEDTGPFVEGLLKVSPGKNLLAYKAMLTMEEFAAAWAEALGVKGEVRDVRGRGPPPGLSEDDLAFMQEIREMVEFSAEFGYAGQSVDKSVDMPEEVSSLF